MTETITKDGIFERVSAALVDFGVEDEITRDSTFEDLDVDSLDLVELGQIVEDEYGVVLSEDDFKEIRTVGHAIDLIASRAGA